MECNREDIVMIIAMIILKIWNTIEMKYMIQKTKDQNGTPSAGSIQKGTD